MKDIVLNIQINSAGIKFFNDYNEQIVIIRPLSINDQLKVVCAAFTPFPGNDNTVTFINDWYEYVSTEQIAQGNTIAIHAKQNATIGKAYIFNNTGFGVTGTSGLPNKYGLINNFTGKSAITCGLAETISINGTQQLSVICANSTPINQTTYFKVDSTVWIMAASQIPTNMMIDTNELKPNHHDNNPNRPVFNIGPYLEIDLNTTTTIYFDNNTNLFQKGNLPEN